jgi:hypothetical protein
MNNLTRKALLPLILLAVALLACAQQARAQGGMTLHSQYDCNSGAGCSGSYSVTTDFGVRLNADNTADVAGCYGVTVQQSVGGTISGSYSVFNGGGGSPLFTASFSANEPPLQGNLSIPTSHFSIPAGVNPLNLRILQSISISINGSQTFQMDTGANGSTGGGVGGTCGGSGACQGQYIRYTPGTFPGSCGGLGPDPASCQTITGFSASPSAVGVGGSTTLSWSTSNASSVDILDLATGQVIASGQPANGSLPVTPPSSRSYRVVAHGSCADVSADVAVTVCPAAGASSFSSSPSSINPGDSSTLSWNVPAASSVTISGVGTFGPSGSVSVSPSATTTYTLTASGDAGCSPVTLQTTVSVGSCPSAAGSSFTATPASISPGGNSTLTWNVPNATGVTISGVGTFGPSGSVSVSPSASTTYTLTSSGPGSCSAVQLQASVTVGSCPAVAGSTFSASPSSIVPGGSSTLSWNVPNATSVTISGVAGTFGASGSVSVSPASTTTYTLTAAGPGTCSSIQLQTTVTVASCPSAAGSSFSASPSSINPGDSSTLSWNVPNATGVTISGVGSFGPSGTAAVSPSSTTTYTLTASGPGTCSPVTLQTTVTVAACPTAAGSSFSASPSSISAGGSSTLSWSVPNATGVTISGVGSFGPSGNVSVSPSSSTTYTLTASGPGTCSPVTLQTTVTVNQPPTINSFTGSPACAGSSTTLSWTSTGGTSATITDLATSGVSSVPVNGSLAVTPPSSRTYRLTVSNGAGAVSQDLPITVTPLAVINSYTASAGTINVGQSVTFTFSVSNTAARSITDLATNTQTPLNVESGTATFTPPTTRTYRLSAISGCNTVTQDLTISVNQPPTINSLAASPSAVCPGQSSNITWTTSGASSATITNLSSGSVTSVPVNGSLTVTPAATTTYRLTATNGAGSTTQDVVVTVNSPPSISSFASSGNNIAPGQGVLLSWSATGASATITDMSNGDVTPVAVSGSESESPTATTTYRLTVTNGCGTVTRDVTVTVVAPPTITAFAASVSPACLGQTINLTWTASGGDSATINATPTQLPGGPASVNPNGGTLPVTPTETTTYTLSVYNSALSPENNHATATVTVTVIPPASITSYSASAMTIGAGQSTVLSYALRNSATATITDLTSGQVTNVPVQTGNLTVTPTTTRTYRLTAAGDCGSPVTQDITITVSACQLISTFSATLNSVAAGQSTQLNWSTSGGTSATITDLTSGAVTSVPVNGSLTVTPATTRTYRLTLNGPCAAVTQDVTITVTSCTVISSFNASPQTINVGGGTTLTWNVNGTSATITDLTTGDVWPIPVPSGSLDLTPTQTTTYRLTVQSPCGQATRDVTVTVIQSPIITRFLIQPIPICQGQPATLIWNSTGGTSAIITGPDLPGSPVSVPVNGTLTVTPPKTTTYTLTVFNDNIPDPDNNYAAKSVSASVTVPGATPVFSSFTATPATVTSGGSTTLQWATTQTSSVDIIDLATNQTIATGQAANGSLVVTPAFSRSYRALAHNGSCASATQDVAVTVIQCPTAAGSTFTASPGSVTQGQSSTLSWNVPNATSVSISGVAGTFGATGTVSVSPSATTTYTLTASGGGTCSPVTLQTTVSVAATGAVLIGPKGQPGATGPTSNNDDTTNMTQTVGVAEPAGGVTTSGGVVNFTNTILNPGSSADTYTLRAPTIPAGFTVEVNAGAGFVSLNNSATATVSVGPGATFDISVRITAPSGISVLTGYPTVIRATSGLTPANFNETIDKVWTGFVSAVKSVSVTNTTGVGSAGDAVPGATITYVVNYTNVAAATAGSGNVDLVATNVILTEDGSASPNNWASLTTAVPGGASDTLGGAITGDISGSTLLRDTISKLDPGQSGTFTFKRIIK